MNPVKSVTDTLRSNFYATVLAVASLGALSSCGGEEEIKPTEPTETKIENINGQLSVGNDGVSRALSFGTTNIETVIDFAFRVKDEATGDVYVVESAKSNASSANATMTLSEVDVIMDQTKLALAYDNTLVRATPTKEIVGTIDFKPGHGSNEINLPSRLYGLKKVQFTANQVSLEESGQEEKLQYLAADKNKAVFKEVMHGLMQSVNDNRPAEPGDQPMPLFVTVSKLN